MTITFPIHPTFEFYDASGNLFTLTSPILHRFLSELTTSTNTVTSETTEEQSLESSSGEFHSRADDNAQIEDAIPVMVPGREFFFDVKTQDYTAVNNDFIEARFGARIKLDSNCGYNDQIITCNGDGSSVIFDGNGIELRYKGERGSTVTSSREGTSIHWYLFASDTERYWRAS